MKSLHPKRRVSWLALLPAAALCAAIGVMVIFLAGAATTLVGDINKDNKVDVFDLSQLLNKWDTADVAADLNASGKVDVFDLSMLLSQWGAVAPSPTASPTPTPTPTPTATATPTQAENIITFASIPDTQRDVHGDAAGISRFNGRLSWLVSNRAALNLKYVMQIGDLHDWDTADHIQYKTASAGLKILENAGIPYALTPGNHDGKVHCAGGGTCPGVNLQTALRDTATWNSYYPPSRFALDGVYESGKTDNAYRTFTAGGLNWLVINYEVWPRAGVVSWMKTVVASHPRHNVILVTHHHLEPNSTIATTSGYGSNSPKYVFDQLISKHPNVKFVFSGHTGNAGYRTDTGFGGSKVYSFLDSYHDTTNNLIRLVTLDIAAGTIKTKVYAPNTNLTRSDGNINITGVTWVR